MERTISVTDRLDTVYNQDSDEGDLENPPKLSNFGSELISDSLERRKSGTLYHSFGSNTDNVSEQNDTKSSHPYTNPHPITRSVSSPLFYEEPSQSTMFAQSKIQHQPSMTTYNLQQSPKEMSENSNTFMKMKSKQNSMKQELTMKYNERRTRRFLHATNRTTRLGPAQRNCTQTNNIEDDLKTTSSNSAPQNETNHYFDSNDAYMDFQLMKTDSVTETNSRNIDNTKLESPIERDYSDIDIKACNPIQYMKMHNLPATELSKISKAYFEKQKEENRILALKNLQSRDLSMGGKPHSTVANDYLQNRADTKDVSHVSDTSSKRKPTLRERFISVYGAVHSPPPSSTSKFSDLHRETGQENIPNHSDYDLRVNNREALGNIDINSNKENISEIKKQKTVDSINDVVPQKRKYKKVEIVEPPSSGFSQARKNMITVNGSEYERIELLGRGGSSNVYKVRASKNKVFALKKVSFDEFDDSSVEGFKGEIELLKKLQNQQRVVQLFDYEMGRGVLYLLMECGDYDLSQVLHQRMNSPLDMEFIRYHAREMVTCVKVVHDAGIVHSDLKPANFVFVKGILKIIDFGIANAVPDHTVNIYRDMQIGTPNYMAPEALIAHNYTNDNENHPNKSNKWKVGKPADIWSCGCIIYQMIYGRPPYGKYQGQDRLLAIMDPKVKIDYKVTTNNDDIVPNLALELMQYCLMRNPDERWTANDILESPFLNPLMVSHEFVRNLITTAVDYGSREGNVSPDKIENLANNVLARLADFRMH
ncbi:serine/threonine/tyrosine protein kinase MPS1 [Nakaseomyces bracarensis]|uniref:serine/threonine/tyrosine protein kinase MPS1 n=1 Tax=Nakaseomyces bracarensis TaxID=273131 RepID=UPI0038717F6B